MEKVVIFRGRKIEMKKIIVAFVALVVFIGNAKGDVTFKLPSGSTFGTQGVIGFCNDAQCINKGYFQSSTGTGGNVYTINGTTVSTPLQTTDKNPRTGVTKTYNYNIISLNFSMGGTNVSIQPITVTDGYTYTITSNSDLTNLIDLQNQIALLQKISLLNLTQSELQNQITPLQNQITSLKNQTASLEKTAALSPSTELQNQITSLQNQITLLKKIATTPLKLEISLLGSAQKIALRNFLQTQITSLQNQFAYLSKKIADQITTTGVAPTSAQLQSQIAALQAQITPLQNKLTPLQTQQSTIQTQITALQNQIKPLQDQLTPLQRQQPTLQPQITQLQNQIKPLQDQLTNLQKLLGTASN